MDSQIIKNSLNQVGFLSRIILQFYARNRSTFVNVIKVAAISWSATVVVNRIYQAYLGPLRNIPGPFIAKFIELPSFIYDMPVGTLFKSMNVLHDTYGGVVRTGPRSVSIADKDMIKQVLVNDDLPKGPAYSLFRKVRETMFSTRNKGFHKHRRRVVSPAFSVKYLNSLEPYMKYVSTTLVKQVDKEIKFTKDSHGYGTINVWNLMQCLALDVIGETAFGQTFHMVENGTHPVPSIIAFRMKVGAYVMAYPSLAKLVLTGEPDPRLVSFVRGVYETRKNGAKRDDILQSLIDTQDAKDPADRLTTDDIIRETVLFLIAGSETTSNTINFAIIELLRHPDKLARLREEIDLVPLDEGDVTFNHDVLKKLPYLNAVINETMRIDPVAAGGLQRYTDRDVSLGSDLMLPENIVILCNLYYAHLNNKYWKDASQFIPERWIPGEKDYDESSDFGAFFPFSSGSRNCIGKNFAWQEMRIALATFLRRYDIAPIAQEMEDSKDIRQYITMAVAKGSFKVKAKLR